MENFNYPLFNAVMNAVGLIFIMLGVLFAKRKKITLHFTMMFIALICSAIFLISYLIYHFQVGHVTYEGNQKALYFFILITHTILSVALLPLIFITVRVAAQSKLEVHRKWVKFTVPTWIYVNSTGVLIYLIVHG